MALNGYIGVDRVRRICAMTLRSHDVAGNRP
jgi:hypothetical protein